MIAGLFWVISVGAFVAFAFVAVLTLRGVAWVCRKLRWRKKERARRADAMPKREQAHLSRRERKAWRELSGPRWVQESRAAPKGEQR